MIFPSQKRKTFSLSRWHHTTTLDWKERKGKPFPHTSFLCICYRESFTNRSLILLKETFRLLFLDDYILDQLLHPGSSWSFFLWTWISLPPPPPFFIFSFKSLRLRGLDFIPSSDCSEARWDHNLAKYISVPEIKQLLQTSELPHWCCWKGIFIPQVETSCWAVGGGERSGEAGPAETFSSPGPF